MQPKVYIIVLNYNNWADTIACSESILANTYTNFQLIIVDNASVDNSMEYIQKWAKGLLESWTPPSHALHSQSYPPQNKPIDYAYCDVPISENQENFPNNQVILIQSSQNNGYSAGNNLGIKFAQAKDDYAYIWVLNNDTIIQKETLQNLVQCAQDSDDTIGLFGSTLLFYDAPEKVQAFGGSFNHLLAVQKHHLGHQKYTPDLVKTFDQAKVDYIIGASMLMTKKCIEMIGLMPEEYFIYFEEIDIATHCKRKGLNIAICSDAIVYHKESASINQEDQKMSSFSDFYAMRNRLLFTRKYHPFWLPSVYFGLILSLLLRYKRGNIKSVKNICKIITTPLSKIEKLHY